MIVVLTISLQVYTRMVHQIVENCPIHSVLMDGVVLYQYDEGQALQKVVKILCDERDAQVILDAAKQIAPEAAVEIKKSIRPFAASIKATSLAVPADRLPIARGRARKYPSRRSLGN